MYETSAFVSNHTPKSKNSQNWIKQSELMLIRFLSIIYNTGLSLNFLGFSHLQTRKTQNQSFRRFLKVSHEEVSLNTIVVSEQSWKRLKWMKFLSTILSDEVLFPYESIFELREHS